jgi:putative hemolysin
MVMLLSGKVPKTADKVEWEGWFFEIVDMDGTRIDKVLAARSPVPASALPERGAAEENGRAS